MSLFSTIRTMLPKGKLHCDLWVGMRKITIAYVHFFGHKPASQALTPALKPRKTARTAGCVRWDLESHQFPK